MVESASAIHHNFGDIHQRFSVTQYGVQLAEQTRFSIYKPTDVPKEQWVQILGADVDNLAHLKLSLGLTKRFLAYCNMPPPEWRQPVPEDAVFHPEEQGILLLTALTHDWAEAIKGDIPFHEKTDQDEVDELLLLRQLISDMLGVTNQTTAEDLAESVTEVLSNKQSKLGRAFNSIERIGYVRTGLRSYKQSDATNGILRDNLTQMGLHVSTFHLPHLMDYAQTYPPVHTFLIRNQPILSHILTTASEQRIQFPNSPDDHIHKIKEKWEQEFIGEAR